ncbi:MAG: dihydrofolate reductase [Pseudomonadota bacterium]
MSIRRHPKPKVSMVVARARNGLIGRDGDLPWRLPADLKHFKRLTVGKPIIMGRKTWTSLGRPLPGRHNIVLTRDTGFAPEGCSVAHTLADALDTAGLSGEIMIIGGAEIYRLALPLATTLYITEVGLEPKGDTFFPVLQSDDWREVDRISHAANDDTPAYDFVTYDRVA